MFDVLRLLSAEALNVMYDGWSMVSLITILLPSLQAPGWVLLPLLVH